MILMALGAPKEALLTYSHTLDFLTDRASDVLQVARNAHGAGGGGAEAGDPRQWAPDNEGADAQGLEISLQALSVRHGQLLARGDVPVHQLQLYVLGRELALLLAEGRRQQAAARAVMCTAAIVRGLRARGYSPGQSLGGSRGVSPLHAASLVLNVALNIAAVVMGGGGAGGRVWRRCRLEGIEKWWRGERASREAVGMRRVGRTAMRDWLWWSCLSWPGGV
jgi:hypothetical protein